MISDFSVLMSLYIKEKPEYLEACLQSLLHQTLPAKEWVIVEDGPLTKELYAVLDSYEKNYPGLIKRVPLEKNQGLGLALRAGVPACSYELIARMDTDDISREDRFEKQIQEFQNDDTLDICGSNISEFEGDVSNIVAHRIVPADDLSIKKYQKRRDGFNHVSVMFKKSSVLAAGNYQSCPLMEDTLLWVNMMLNGVKCKNIMESLVYVRIGKDMYERRGGWSYFKKYSSARKRILDTGYISWFDYMYTILVQLVVALMPGSLRGWLFKKVLHG